ncbi:tetratricopeptide repeat protein 33 isoform X1 [Phyllopteryx taeniolatus]|uniref:tetratricopeptide repeat protein 33 isoform X1 n=1 Tax=Phyllopteryx taeniolatus TaxID=161469 RepID=UPI002AD3C45B|nr:tetratricopeptide repeat protein 33 isoform X1 [Phyllopteryx taeniolatus]XP_061603933.1 tetratricopeptide repeat protein 33 isoform X1 [Phyllopteryx taeniolatus]XP_061603934.1 tetratricopeptide repeat protein 33 isoform X1 [Phyllopteryx taeniolatus]XP_061603935.1 tetratricopeptide repeat protein 33 isoform X1 [Phyllopteryx taeniolatus]
MASFGWKRKAGERVSKSAARHFEEADQERNDADGQVDWQQAVKRRRETLLGDCAAESQRLKEEGTALAEQNRHREAVKKWDEAIQLTPDDPLLHEMKAQVLTTLQEVFPAVEAAETAVKLRSVWWEGWQTLGRAQLSMGEVDLALRSFQVAVHLRPWERALRQDDLAWARTLRRQKEAAGENLRRREEDDRLRLSDVPELRGDFDFESDEVVAACEAVARRQALPAAGNVLASGEGASGDAAEPSLEDFVKVRRL